MCQRQPSIPTFLNDTETPNEAKRCAPAEHDIHVRFVCPMTSFCMEWSVLKSAPQLSLFTDGNG